MTNVMAGFANSSFLHLGLLAAGVVMLMRRRGARAGLAAISALSAALGTWFCDTAQAFVAHSGFAWLPWAWWAMEQVLAMNSGRLRWVLPAPFVFLVLHAGEVFTTGMLAIVTAWLVVRAWSENGWRAARPL